MNQFKDKTKNAYLLFYDRVSHWDYETKSNSEEEETGSA